MKEGRGFHIFMGILSCWLAAGALIKIFCSEKVVGALIGVGALKGMNTVSFFC